MKIIQHGILTNDFVGLPITCPNCRCCFRIDSDELPKWIGAIEFVRFQNEAGETKAVPIMDCPECRADVCLVEIPTGMERYQNLY